ncbi:hypothetical protein EA438_10115, partial [Streptococcus dysgalactiae subsp. dysgalactiae]|nr:hypothetical protein [Streptococcus dysgalactiae subsp. dysgalactiae]
QFFIREQISDEQPTEEDGKTVYQYAETREKPCVNWITVGEEILKRIAERPGTNEIGHGVHSLP